MPSLLQRCTRESLAALFLLACACSFLVAPQISPAQTVSRAPIPPRAVLKPKLVPGMMARYQVQFKTTSSTRASGAVSDPQGPSKTTVTWAALLRLEVLGDPFGGASAPAGPIRLRTTYEKSSASVDSDSPDPEAPNVMKQYADMQGKTLEFTIAPGGAVSDVRGLEGIVSGADALKAAQQWMTQFSAGPSAPDAGVAPGDKWSFEEPADWLPLAGYAWRTDLTYLRNEPCAPAGQGSAVPAALQDQTCAVILTQLLLLPPRSQKDSTPDSYRRNSLHTAGSWDGSGEGITTVSLKTGWVVSVTQNMSEKIDVTISGTLNTSVRYAGTVNTHSEMSLVSAQSNVPSGLR